MMVRRGMVRILIDQQLLRLKKNPAAILLLIMTIGIALLIGVSGLFRRPAAAEFEQAASWIVYDVRSDWIDHLRNELPAESEYRLISRADDLAQISPTAQLIEVEQIEDGQQSVPYRVNYRMGAGGATDMDSFQAWFWRQTADHFGNLDVAERLIQPPVTHQQQSDAMASTSLRDLLTPGLVAVLLIFSIQFFVCTHLQVSLVSQDRERGTSLALALSPASLVELLTARAIFHVALSVLVCGVIVGIMVPGALTSSVLWPVMLLGATGFLSVGIVISSIARSQGTAGMSTVCYMLFGAIIFYLAAQFPAIGLLRQLAFEHYGVPLLIHAMHGGAWTLIAVQSFVKMLIVVILWLVAASRCYQQFGWQ